MSHRVLVIEDDDGIAVPLVRTLEREGYQVERTAEGLPGLERARSGDIELIILDLGLPDIDGLELCRRARAEDIDAGIIVLTARGGELDRVVGLDMGADDYLAKPFGLAELLARARALLRRSRPPSRTPPTTTAADGLRVDAQARRAWVGTRELSLTSKEFDLLALLAMRPGSVLTRERLMDEVWDSNWYGSTKTLDVTVGRLRQKLQDAAATARVVTVRGVGFRLEDGAADA